MTLPDNPTAQQVFDHVVTSVLAQGYRCTDLGGACAYHTPAGARCAVGWCLPEDVARAFAEYAADSVTSVVEDMPLADLGAPAWVRLHLDLLSDLQYAHDNAGIRNGMPAPQHFAADFRAAARTVASSHDLDPAVCAA